MDELILGFQKQIDDKWSWGVRGTYRKLNNAIEDITLTANSTWGDLQVSGQTPIHGGPQELGIYNAMQTVPRADGKREVVSGSSYLQIVTFDDQGPHAQGVLAFSLSSNPASTYSKDQTQAFSEKKLRPLPFTDAQIKAEYEVYKTVVAKQKLKLD